MPPRTKADVQPLDHEDFPGAGRFPVEFQPSAEFDPGNVGDEEMTDEVALNQVLASLGETESEAKVYVYKCDDKSKNGIYLYTCSPSEFASGGLDEIQAAYGAGDYKIRVYSGGRVVTHRRLTVGAPRITSEKKQDSSPASAEIILQAMNNQSQMLLQGMMQGFQELAKAIRPTEQPSRADFMKEMLLMKEMFSSEKSAGPDMGSMMELFKQGIEIGKVASGNGDSTLDVLKSGVEMFGPVLANALQQQQTQAAQAPAQIAPQLPQPVQQPQIQQQQSQSENEDVNIVKKAMLAQSLNFLVSNARKGSDPALYAEMVLDQLDDTEVQEFIGRPDWQQFLASINPAVLEPGISDWFVKMRDEIHMLLTDTGETGNDSPHANGASQSPESGNGNPAGNS